MLPNLLLFAQNSTSYPSVYLKSDLSWEGGVSFHLILNKEAIVQSVSPLIIIKDIRIESSRTHPVAPPSIVSGSKSDGENWFLSAQKHV